MNLKKLLQVLTEKERSLLFALICGGYIKKYKRDWIGINNKSLKVIGDWVVGFCDYGAYFYLDKAHQDELLQLLTEDIKCAKSV